MMNNLFSKAEITEQLTQESVRVDVFALERMIKEAQEGGISTDPIKKIIKEALLSNCTIKASFGNDVWTGSGFHIGNGYVATVEHVAPVAMIGKEYLLEITFNGANFLPAKIITGSEELDISLIHCTEAKDMPSVILGNSDLIEVGDVIAVIASPEGWHDTATVGRVSNKNQNLGNYAPSPAWNDMIFVDADIAQGSSGGMAIATDGKVYGIVMGITGDNAEVGVGQNAIIPINKLQTIIDTLEFKK